VFFDIKAMQPQEQHVPSLVVVETEDDPRPFRFKGEHCIPDFLQWLDTAAMDDTREVHVLANKGYDGYFVAHEYRDQNCLIQ